MSYVVPHYFTLRITMPAPLRFSTFCLTILVLVMHAQANNQHTVAYGLQDTLLSIHSMQQVLQSRVFNRRDYRFLNTSEDIDTPTLDDGYGWLQYSHSHLLNEGNKRDHTDSVTIGADIELPSHKPVATGIAYRHVKYNHSVNDVLPHRDSDQHAWNIYSSYYDENFFFHGILNYGIGRVDGFHTQKLASSLSTLKYWGFDLSGGYQIPLSHRLFWLPQLGYSLYRIEIAKGGEWQGYRYSLFELNAGMQLMDYWQLDQITIAQKLMVMGARNFNDVPQHMVYQQEGEWGKNRLLLQFAVDIFGDSALAFSLGVSREWYKKMSVNSGQIWIRYVF